jgi:hypothetical protein
MKHRASPRFWACYRRLPEEIQRLADRGYELLCNNPRHPSLHLKQVRELWSVRVGLHYRALAIEDDGELTWIWIGPHAEYNRIVRHQR